MSAAAIPKTTSAGADHVAETLAERMFATHRVNDIRDPEVHLTRAQLVEVLATAFMIGAEAYRHFGPDAHVVGDAGTLSS